MSQTIHAGPLERLVDGAIEQALLGALLISNRWYDKAAEKLEERDFGNGLHGRIFAAIGKAIERGMPANPVTLRGIFDGDETLVRERGGGKYLVQLAAAGAMVHDVISYADMILDLSRRRQIVIACQDAIADASTLDAERPAARVIEDHEQELAGIAEGRQTSRGLVPLRTAVAEALQATEAAYKNSRPHLSTGLIDLDSLIGGWLPGDLEVIAGRPAMGKTALALGLAYHAASAGIPVLYFSLEQPREQLAQRLLSRNTNITASRQQRGALDSIMWQRCCDEANRVSPLSIHIDDTPALSSGQICARVRRARRRSDVGLVIIDHLQLLREEGKREARRLEIDNITGTFKALAKELSLPVILLSQLSRAVEARENKRPMMSDLRESGGIEQDADRVIFIYREEYYLGRKGDLTATEKTRLEQVAGFAELIVDKDRHGRGGTIRVRWDGKRMIFSDLAR